MINETVRKGIERREHVAKRRAEAHAALVAAVTGKDLRRVLRAYEETGDHNHGRMLIPGAPCPGGDCWVLRARKLLALMEAEAPAYRPVPGKLTVEMVQNRIVTVKRYGTDVGGDYVEVQFAGSYGAHMKLPLSSIRPLTDEDRRQAAEMADAGHE